MLNVYLTRGIFNGEKKQCEEVAACSRIKYKVECKA